MKNEDIFLKIVKQNPNIYQYTKFKAGIPYISGFDSMGKRIAKHVTQQDVERASKLSTDNKQPVLAYNNGVYCWSFGPDAVFLFVEPDLAHALSPNCEPLKTEYVPMSDGETLLTFPSLMHMRNTSYRHQKAKLEATRQLQHQK